jgi:hypothetical protein
VSAVQADDAMGGRFVMVDLGPWLNLKSAGYPDQRDHINVTGMGSGFAAEHFPPAGGVYRCGGVPFRVPDFRHGANDNLLLQGETIPLPPGPCRCLHFWGFAETSLAGARLMLVFAGGERRDAWLGLSSLGAQSPESASERPGPASPVIRTPVADYARQIMTWVQSVPVPGDGVLDAIEFEDMPVLHIFALTLERPAARREVSAHDRG